MLIQKLRQTRSVTARSVTRLRRPMTPSSLKQLVPPLSQKQTDKSWFAFGYPDKGRLLSPQGVRSKGMMSPLAFSPKQTDKSWFALETPI